MQKLKAAIQRVKDRLTGKKADLAKARRRHKIYREKSGKLHGKWKRAESHPKLAALYKRRWERAHKRERYWLERIRRDKKSVHKLESIESKLEHDVNEWLKMHGAQLISHNKIAGGDYEERSHLAQSTAMINHRNGTGTIGSAYYSMSGAPRVYSHTLWHYPRGHIWDCSTYGDGTKYVTGDPSPSGPHGFRDGGWTGTELENCKRVSEHEAKIGDLVIYLGGPMGSHHVEVVYNPDKKITSGHGDEAINLGCHGSYDLFGDGNYVVVRPPREIHEHMLAA